MVYKQKMIKTKASYDTLVLKFAENELKPNKLYKL